jgi:Uma2 family endonuclease
MASEPRPRLSIPEYLALERDCEVRHEYLDGEMFAMSHPTRRHSLIAGNLFGQIWTQFRGRRCEVHKETLRIRTPSGLFAYPDVGAVCSKPSFDDAKFNTLLNPALIIEVLSPSTEDYDRITKWAHYRSIPSLLEYVLVSQDRVYVEQIRKQENGGWMGSDLDEPGQALELQSIACRLSLTEIYGRVSDEE